MRTEMVVRQLLLLELPCLWWVTMWDVSANVAGASWRAAFEFRS